MKNQILNLLVITTFAFLLGSCSKDDNSTGSGGVNSGPFPTTNSPNSPNAAVNTQPTGCGTYNPMFKGSYMTYSRNGSNTDTIYSFYVGKDTTINGKSYAISWLNSSSSNLIGYTRREGSKTISYSYLSPTPFEMVILDESKKVNEEWNGGQFVMSIPGGGLEVTNQYTLKIVKQHSTYTLSNGLSFKDVIEVNMKLVATTKFGGATVSTVSTDAGNQFYAKCVGAIKSFTPKNTTAGIMNDLTQEIKRYKM